MKIYIISILIFINGCVSQNIKENVTKETKNFGKLKLNIIGLKRNYSASESFIQIRGSKYLPDKPQFYFRFEKENDFILEGSAFNNEKTEIRLTEGEYFAFLHLNDTRIRPLLITTTAFKTIMFGYSIEQTDKLLIGEMKKYKLIRNEKLYCIEEKNIYICPPIKIENSKTTEITLNISEDEKFDENTTALLWITTPLIPTGLSPGILLGSAVFKKNIEHSIKTK